MTLSIVKMSGAGNDFVLVEGGRAALARRLCDRREGVGADGLLVPSRARGGLRLEYYNADGSKAFCGNGLRCAAWWAYRKGWAGKTMSFRTAEGLVSARVLGRERAGIRMPQPKGLRLGLTLKAAGRAWTAHAVDTGVPHAVVETRALETFPVVEVGRALRRHPAFAPRGANVNFAAIGRSGLSLRTYERGVEDETLACGTGAAAAAVVAHSLKGLRSPIKVKARGGELVVRFRADGASVTDLWVEGPARIVFEGRITL